MQPPSRIALLPGTCQRLWWGILGLRPTSRAPSFCPQISFKPILICTPTAAPLPFSAGWSWQPPEHGHVHTRSHHSPAGTARPGLPCPLQHSGPCLGPVETPVSHRTRPSVSPSQQGHSAGWPRRLPQHHQTPDLDTRAWPWGQKGNDLSWCQDEVLPGPLLI